MKDLKKKRILTAVMAAAVITSTVMAVSCAVTPSEEMEKDGIIQGYEDGEMHLERNVTRAEFAKMLINVMEKAELTINGEDDEKKEKEFTDLPKDHWAYTYVQRAVEGGIINGIDDKIFAPDENITYEQAVKMVISAFEYMYENAEYPRDYIASAIDGGYLYGVKAVTGEKMTRDDAVNLLYNALDKLENEKKSRVDRGNRSSIGSGSSGGGGGNVSMLNAAKALMTSENDKSAVMMDSAESNVIMIEQASTPVMPIMPEIPDFNTEEYIKESENVFKNTLTSPLSTFSIDVDTASYSNVRRFIVNKNKIPDGSVRTEEMINYFDYDYEEPTDGVPFSVTTELSVCPWNQNNKLALVGIKGEEIPDEERKPNNLVFLVDISGSMESSNKLPLVQRSLDMMLDKLDGRDKISVVTYASGTGIALDSVSADNKEKIKETIYSLTAGGGTAGADGITLAYELAEKNRVDGNNRIILCTDGDFNIGMSSTAELEKMIEKKRNGGIFLSVLGFGMGNYKDSRMETLADKGNGNYAYIDNVKEAKKVLVDEMTKTIYTIAKDVKIQTEFNPDKVKEYRLIGYENRKLNNEDFDNDKKDAGELGAGASVTALYEIVPNDGESGESGLRYQNRESAGSEEYMYVKLRYKEPDGEESKLIERAVTEESENVSDNFKFSSAVAEFAMILNNSEFKGDSSIESVIELAEDARGEDKFGLRSEFIQLADLYKINVSSEKENEKSEKTELE